MSDTIEIKGSKATHKVDLKKISCTCADFRFRRGRFPKNNPERLCKHLKSVEKQIIYPDENDVAPKSRKGRHTRKKVEKLIKRLEFYIARFPIIHKEYCGSYRRGKPTVGDLDVLLSIGGNFEEHFKEIFKLIRSVGTSDILAKGYKKCSIVLDGIQVDIRFVPEKSWPYALLHYTGSREENIRLRAIAVRKNMMLNEYGLFVRDQYKAAEEELKKRRKAAREKKDTFTLNKLKKHLDDLIAGKGVGFIKCSSEEDIYKELDQPFKQPTER